MSDPTLDAKHDFTIMFDINKINDNNYRRFIINQQSMLEEQIYEEISSHNRNVLSILKSMRRAFLFSAFIFVLSLVLIFTLIIIHRKAINLADEHRYLWIVSTTDSSYAVNSIYIP